MRPACALCRCILKLADSIFSRGLGCHRGHQGVKIAIARHECRIREIPPHMSRLLSERLPLFLRKTKTVPLKLLFDGVSDNISETLVDDFQLSGFDQKLLHLSQLRRIQAPRYKTPFGVCT